MVEHFCLQIVNKVPDQLKLPSPNRCFVRCRIASRTKLQHDCFLSDMQSNIPKLTFEQTGIHDQKMQTINKGVEEIFLDAPGRTDKMLLIRLILATIRSQNDIALVLASSGIAATLLPGGRIAHSALKLPLNECTMAHKKSVEGLDRSLQDLRGNTRPFGNGVQLQNDRSAGIFSHQLLEIGNGKMAVDLTSGRISLPHNSYNFVTSKEGLAEKLFPDIQTN
ncbi:unnamed protein product, partial [Onchocerca ochengi]|uniref:ATP-dependent DNA helicase n=1 Tax=Onchocerca ochengi TaxID=42157 RepID=A0A182EUS0_ONCOC